MSANNPQTQPPQFPPPLNWWKRLTAVVAVALITIGYGFIGGMTRPKGPWHWVFVGFGAVVGLFIGVAVCLAEAHGRRRRWELDRAIDIMANSPRREEEHG